jgi:hypothetical protein
MKSLQTRMTTTTDAKWWQKLTWPFWPGELKRAKAQFWLAGFPNKNLIIFFF